MQIRLGKYQIATPPTPMESFAKNLKKCPKLYPQIPQQILGLFQNQRYILVAINELNNH